MDLGYHIRGPKQIQNPYTLQAQPLSDLVTVLHQGMEIEVRNYTEKCAPGSVLTVLFVYYRVASSGEWGSQGAEQISDGNINNKQDCKQRVWNYAACTGAGPRDEMR